jgi:hypothetical protein
MLRKITLTDILHGYTNCKTVKIEILLTRIKSYVIPILIASRNPDAVEETMIDTKLAACVEGLK